MTLVSGQRPALQSETARKQHRDAWLIVLGIGCLVILFGNLLGTGPWFVAFVVAAVMIGYALYIERHVDDIEVPGDTKGDSIYYLGLLFTFVALVAALITFDWGAPGGDASGTTGSIRNFGIALLTTIVGLAGRVWFTMSHESPGDIVDTTRSELEETVSRMKESLDRARDDLDIMAHKFRDSAAGLGAMAETIAEGAGKTAATYESLDAYAGYVANATASLTGAMDRLRGECGACSGALTTLQGHAEGLGVRFDDVQARLDDQLGGVRARLDTAGAAFDRVNEVAGSTAERVDVTLRGVENTDAAVAALGQTLSGVRESAKRAEGALAGIADAVDEHRVLPLWKEAVDQLHAGTRGIRGIGRHAADMNAEFEGLRESLRDARDGLGRVPGTARDIRDQLAEVGRRRARELTEGMEEIAAVDVPVGPAAALAGRIRRAAAGVRRTMARLARFRRRS